MKDEEMADKYAVGLCKTCKVDVCRHSTIRTCAIKESIKQAYLDGLKAQPKWHKVKSGDLPPDDTVCIAHFYRKNVWDKIGIVIAWCEIPTYFEDDIPRACNSCKSKETCAYQCE